MAVSQITKTLTYSFPSLLHTKFRYFLKKGLWKYALACILLSVLIQFSGTCQTCTLPWPIMFGGLMGTLMGINVLSIIISSYLESRDSAERNMIITFTESLIIIEELHK